MNKLCIFCACLSLVTGQIGYFFDLDKAMFFLLQSLVFFYLGKEMG